MRIKDGSSRFGYNVDISGEQVHLKRRREVVKGEHIEVGFIVELEGTLYTGYPAPPCSNPDHPNFSDSGCGPEGDFKVVGVEEIEIHVNRSKLDKHNQRLLDAIDMDDDYAAWLSELFCLRFGIDLYELTVEEYSQCEDDLCDRCMDDGDRF
jgi:hypothetical protein